mmetsp:Transcript_8122/g.8329  ORF Transcript_8122/g.8329 Transcript_8122/m.8329 type:complete len:190 (-) Transcript_8122:352-921(-)
MDSGMKEVGPIIMTGGQSRVGGRIGRRMRSHSFADSTSRVPNSNRSAFQRRNTIDSMDNQATSRQTSSSNEEKRALSTIFFAVDLSSLSLNCDSTSDTDIQATESASKTDNQVTKSASDAPEEHHEQSQCNIRQLTQQFSMSCVNPWTDDCTGLPLERQSFCNLTHPHASFAIRHGGRYHQRRSGRSVF